MIKTLVLKGDKFICIKDFYSLAGDLVFREGKEYEANNNNCIISGKYNLHVTASFFNYFQLRTRYKQSIEHVKPSEL